MEEVFKYLKGCENYYLATVYNNHPEIRPFATINLFEDKIYFFTDKTKNVSKQIISNPYIQLCAMSNGTWIRLEATAVEDSRTEAIQHMLDSIPILKDVYSATDGKSQVFYLKDATATIMSFTDKQETFEF